MFEEMTRHVFISALYYCFPRNRRFNLKNRSTLLFNLNKNHIYNCFVKVCLKNVLIETLHEPIYPYLNILETDILNFQI